MVCTYRLRSSERMDLTGVNGMLQPFHVVWVVTRIVGGPIILVATVVYFVEYEPEHPDTCRCEVCRFWGA